MTRRPVKVDVIYIIIIIKRQLISRRNMPEDITRARYTNEYKEEAEHAVTENERPGYETENKKDLSRLLKVSIDSALCTMSGRLFQAAGPANAKARLPSAWNDEVAFS